jgi:hypothetical protein
VERAYSIDRSNDLRAQVFADLNADPRMNKKAGDNPFLIIVRICDGVAFLEHRPAVIWREGNGSMDCCRMYMPFSRKAGFWHAGERKTPAVAG